MAELQRRTAVTGWHLRAFLERGGEALADVDPLWLREALAQRGGRVLAAPRRRAPAPAALEPCLRAQFEHHFYPEARVLFADDPAIEAHLRRYDYVGATRDASALEDPRLRRVVQALFEPLRREPGRAI